MTETPMDLQPTNGQIASRAYVYRVKHKDKEFYTVVIATSSTSARNGLLQQYPNSMTSFIGVADQVMQVNG